MEEITERRKRFLIPNGTVSVISIYSPCKDDNVQFKTVLLNAFQIKYEYNFSVFVSLNYLFSFAVFLRISCL